MMGIMLFPPFLFPHSVLCRTFRQCECSKIVADILSCCQPNAGIIRNKDPNTDFLPVKISRSDCGMVHTPIAAVTFPFTAVFVPTSIPIERLIFPDHL
ncbi:hypothetical protein K469DRAFT_98287 [Zopfia rhizophila CBS 207.26]|uniref:Hydrophobin n=1 Tax=Zopfia rhizophila CBS 207.26 TaxID=1314779 RepID=A0A6A6E9Q3_9PEZI|nr:hypothetical protein K469DRAFT_98287 [Zopfia rhizophila CBS 207.26]